MNHELCLGCYDMGFLENILNLVNILILLWYLDTLNNFFINNIDKTDIVYNYHLSFIIDLGWLNKWIENPRI